MNIRTVPLNDDMDARRWAREFNESLIKNGEQPIDPDLLLGWFANAIMCGYDIATRKAVKIEQNNIAPEQEAKPGIGSITATTAVPGTIIGGPIPGARRVTNNVAGQASTTEALASSRGLWGPVPAAPSTLPLNAREIELMRAKMQADSLCDQAMRAIELERDLTEKDAEIEDAHLSCIAAEEERELLRKNNLKNCLQVTALQESLLKAEAELAELKGELVAAQTALADEKKLSEAISRDCNATALERNELQAKLASVTQCLEQATNSVTLSALQIETIGGDFIRAGFDIPELRELCLQGMSAIALKAKLARFELAQIPETVVAAHSYDALKARLAKFEAAKLPEGAESFVAKVSKLNYSAMGDSTEWDAHGNAMMEIASEADELRTFAAAQTVRAEENEQDARRWRYGEINGFPAKGKIQIPGVTTNWYYRGWAYGTANEAINATLKHRR